MRFWVIRLLTTSADTTFLTSAGNDTFVGLIGTDGLSANGTTLNAGDVLDGKAGTDTLSISISGTNTVDVTTAALTMSNVENISVANYQTNDAKDNIVNLAGVAGLQKISLMSSSASGDTSFTTARNVVVAEMGNGAGDLSIQYTDAAVVGLADEQTLTLSGQTGGAFTVAGVANTAGVETLNIVSTTSANTIAINDAVTATIKTINVTGSQDLTLTEGAANADDALTVVNASTFTGVLSIATGSAAQDMSITGGTGNDAITLSNFTAADTVNGGAGVDVLTLDVSITAATDLAKVTSIETIVLVGAKDITLAANVAPTTFDLKDANNNVLTLNSGYTNATTVTLESGDKVVNTGANAALTVNMSGADLVTGTSIAGGTATDTINLTADSAATATTQFANITSVNVITIVDAGDAVSGAKAAGKDVNLDLGAYATSLTINASALDAGVTGVSTDATNENLVVDGDSVGSTRVLNITGGGGLDTITGGAGNDIINGGAGNDSINGSVGGNDSILGGDGVDTINMGTALTANDTIDGGLGNDTLIVTTLSAAALANVTNIETLAFTGTATLTTALSFSTIDLSNGTNVDLLTLSTGYTGATTVLADAGDVVTNTANVALTVNFSSDDAVTVTGGTAADTLNITASSSTVATASSAITGVEKMVIVDNGDATTGSTALAGEDITIDLASYGTALNIDATALDAGTQAAVTGADNVDYETLTITGVSAKTLTVTGGAGADTMVGSSDAAAGDSLTGGAGNDTFTMAGNLSYTDTIDGGVGKDTLATTGVLTDVAFMKVTNVESLTVTDTSTLSTYFDATGIANIAVASNKLVDASGTATGHSFTVSATDAVDSIYGGLGADTFTFAGTLQLKATDVIKGSTGTDTIVMDNSVASVAGEISFNTAAVIGVEIVKLGSVSGLASTSAETVALTLTDITATTVQTITLDGAAITDSNDTITITNNVTTTTGGTKFSIVGGAGADTLAGGVLADTISGGLGADVITGNAGADNLTGGAGNDVFAYTLANSAIAASDTITDFATAADKIQITHTVTADTTFDGTNKGTSNSNTEAMTLLSGSAGTTTSRAGQYYFNTTTGQMVLDADGNGLIQSTDFAVTLTSMTSIGAADVAFVLTDSTGAETITTGGGSDTINLTELAVGGADADSVNAGAGDDTVNTNSTALDGETDTINGGLGNDTLNIAKDAADATVAFDHNDELSGVENIVLGTGITSFTGSAQLEALNITTSNSGVTVVVGQAAAHTVTGGTGVDTISLARADLAAIGSIAGGTGTDILLINTASTAIVDADFARVSAVETLQLTGASTIVLGAAAFAAGIVTVNGQNSAAANNTAITSTSTLMDTVVAGADNTGTLTVTFGDIADNAAAVTAGKGNATVVGGSAGDTITVTGLVTASQTFTGSVAAFNVTAGAGAQTIVTGAAVDTITGGEAADIITAGAGADVIDLTEGTPAIDTINFNVVADFGDVVTAFAIGTGAGKDDLTFASTFAGTGLAGAVTFAAAVAYDASQSTTLTALGTAAGTDSEGYIVELTGSTMNATLITAIEAALTGGTSAAGAGFVLVDNGTDSWLLYDSDFNAASTLSIVAKLVGIADITGATDVVIAA